MDDSIFSDPRPFDYFPGDDRSAGVLLIHGFTGTPAEIRYLGKGLSSRGMGAHCPLLDGHGTSVEDLSKTRWRDWMRSVEEKVEALEKIYRPENFFIGGLSMGSLLAIHCYARNPGKFAGLVVMAAPLRLPLFTEYAISCYKLMHLPFDIKVPKLGGPDVVDDRVRSLIPSYMHHSIRAAVSLQEFSRKVRREDLSQLEGDVLVLHGKYDVTTPPANVELMRGEAEKARIRTRIFGRSGHLIPVDYDRDEVVECVADFIGGQGAKDRT
ncbi:MAG: alpha/beta fold hydrolase [Pseudomonadota bacterium]